MDGSCEARHMRIVLHPMWTFRRGTKLYRGSSPAEEALKCDMFLLPQGHHQSVKPEAKPRTFEVRRWGFFARGHRQRKGDRREDFYLFLVFFLG